MSSYIQKKMEKLKVTDEDIIRWAKENGYASLLGNIGLIRQIYIDAEDDEELEFPDLEMHGTRVSVKDIPLEEWVVLRIFMFKIARTTIYNMCPETNCYARVSNSECQAREEKSHGYVTEPVKGIRHYYRAGDGGEDGKSIFVIVPAKYAMNEYNFEHQWCDVKGIWNDSLEGFYANLILPISEEELEKGGIDAPIPPSRPEVEEGEVIADTLPKGLDYSAFSKKPAEEPKEDISEADSLLKSELVQFAQIIPFFGKGNYGLSDFDDFMESNKIQTPLIKLIEGTPGCSIKGDGPTAKVFYEKP